MFKTLIVLVMSCLTICSEIMIAYAAEDIAHTEPVIKNKAIEPAAALQLMKTVSNNVQAEIKRNRDAIANNASVIYGIVDRVVLPHVDFIEMSKWMSGKTIWNKASIAEQAAFIKEFKTLVVRTYATSLSKYTDEKIEFFPLQKSASPNRIQIASKIVRTNKEDLRVDYRLLAGEKGWKLYDIIIEGVSLLKGFQAQFSEQIRNQGLSAVTAQIRQHNAGGSGR